MRRVQGKVAIVTGAARGQGESHTRLLLAEGAAVLMTDVLDELGENVAADLREAGHDVHYLHMDVTSEEDWRHAISQVKERWGRLDILLNNAGTVGSMKPAETEDLAGWNLVTRINQQGVFLGIKHAAPVMRESGGGSIVNTCSTNGSVGAAGFFAYQASKGAVKMMTKAAAMEFVGDNIRVNSVSPALVMTPMAVEEGEESNKAFIAATPMQRAAAPEEISQAILFLASDAASYVTGTDLKVDGGFTAQ